MKKTARIGVRLTPNQRQRLMALSNASELSLSELARRGTIALIAHAERHGWRIVLPFDLDESFEVKPLRKIK